MAAAVSSFVGRSLRCRPSAARKSRRSWRPRHGGGVGHPAVVGVLGVGQSADDGLAARPSRPAADRPGPAAPPAAPGRPRRQAARPPRIASTDLGVRRQHLHGVAPHAGRRMLQRRTATAVAVAAFDAVERPQPCSVHRAWIAPTFSPIASTLGSRDQRDQRRHHVLACRARPAAAGRAAARTGCRSSAPRPACSGVAPASDSGRRSACRRCCVDDPVDAAVLSCRAGRSRRRLPLPVLKPSGVGLCWTM